MCPSFCIYIYFSIVAPFHHILIGHENAQNLFILLEVLVCSIAEYFYESCCISLYFDEPVGRDKIQKILSDSIYQNV